MLKIIINQELSEDLEEWAVGCVKVYMRMKPGDKVDYTRRDRAKCHIRRDGDTLHVDVEEGK